jgi:hypothetical protein
MKTPNFSKIARIEIFYDRLHKFCCSWRPTALFRLGITAIRCSRAKAVNMMRRKAYHEINERQFIFYRQSFVLGGASIVNFLRFFVAESKIAYGRVRVVLMVTAEAGY